MAPEQIQWRFLPIGGLGTAEIDPGVLSRYSAQDIALAARPAVTPRFAP